MNLTDFPLVNQEHERPSLSTNPNQDFCGAWVSYIPYQNRSKPQMLVNYLFRCNLCAQDPEMYGEGYFSVLKNNFKSQGFAPCGCPPSRKPYTEEQAVVVLSRVLSERGVVFSFKEWAEPYRGLETKVVFKCSVHGEWSTTKLSSVLHRNAGCKQCCYEKIGMLNSKSDEDWVKQFSESGLFPEGTTFSREGRPNKDGKRVANWRVTCPVCKISVLASSSNIARARVGCGCSMHKQTFAYILEVYEDDLPIAIKYGITYNPAVRLNQLKAKNLVSFRVFGFWKFGSVEDCKRAERVCKLGVEPSGIYRLVMPQGWTETTPARNLEKIVKTYEDLGGVLIDGNF